MACRALKKLMDDELSELGHRYDECLREERKVAEAEAKGEKTPEYHTMRYYFKDVMAEAMKRIALYADHSGEYDGSL